MAIKQSNRRTLAITVVAWTIGLLMFFPILWTAVAAFKSESDAYSLPQNALTTPWTLENFGIVQERSDYFRYVFNTVVIAVLSTLLGLLFAVPAAWSMAFAPRTKPSNNWSGWTWLAIIFGCFIFSGLILYANDWHPQNAFVGFALLLLCIIPPTAWVWTRGTTDTLLWMLSTI